MSKRLRNRAGALFLGLFYPNSFVCSRPLMSAPFCIVKPLKFSRFDATLFQGTRGPAALRGPGFSLSRFP